jgi:hypothetical protein
MERRDMPMADAFLATSVLGDTLDGKIDFDEAFGITVQGSLGWIKE